MMLHNQGVLFVLPCLKVPSKDSCRLMGVLDSELLENANHNLKNLVPKLNRIEGSDGSKQRRNFSPVINP